MYTALYRALYIYSLTPLAEARAQSQLIDDVRPFFFLLGLKSEQNR